MNLFESIGETLGLTDGLTPKMKEIQEMYKELNQMLQDKKMTYENVEYQKLLIKCRDAETAAIKLIKETPPKKVLDVVAKEFNAIADSPALPLAAIPLAEQANTPVFFGPETKPDTYMSATAKTDASLNQLPTEQAITTTSILNPLSMDSAMGKLNPKAPSAPVPTATPVPVSPVPPVPVPPVPAPPASPEAVSRSSTPSTEYFDFVKEATAALSTASNAPASNAPASNAPASNAPASRSLSQYASPLTSLSGSPAASPAFVSPEVLPPANPTFLPFSAQSAGLSPPSSPNISEQKISNKTIEQTNNKTAESPNISEQPNNKTAESTYVPLSPKINTSDHPLADLMATEPAKPQGITQGLLVPPVQPATPAEPGGLWGMLPSLPWAKKGGSTLRRQRRVYFRKSLKRQRPASLTYLS